MQFQIPQFIEVEDRIFGPLTFKQFVYLVGGGGISFIIFKALPLFIAALFIAPVVALSLALAFYKVNNKPFVFMLESAAKYMSKGKLYLWRKVAKKPAPMVKQKNVADAMTIPRLSDSKLKDIAWSLGVKESIYADEFEERRVK